MKITSREIEEKLKRQGKLERKRKIESRIKNLIKKGP